MRTGGVLLFGAILALAGRTWAEERGPVSIVLKESAEVRGPGILLGEIATIRAEEPAFVEKLKTVEIGRAPLPGFHRILNRDTILFRLKQHRITLQRLLIEGPETIRVTTEHGRIRGEELFQTAKAYLLEKRNGDHLLITPVSLPPDVLVPKGEVRLKVRPVLNSDPVGSTPLVVEVWVDGKRVRQVSAALRVSLLGEVVVAARARPRHALLQAEDLKMERRDLSALPDRPLMDLGQALGRRTTKPLFKGEVLLRGSVEEPPLVKRGDLVTLIAEAPGLTITAQGRAQGEGGPGHLIRVKNVSSGKEVYGRVESPQVVRVGF